MSAQTPKSDGLSPQTPVQPTQVLLVQGKRANQALRDARRWEAQLRFEEAILSQKGRNVEETHLGHHDSEKEG